MSETSLHCLFKILPLPLMEKVYKKIFVVVIIRPSECLTKHICDKIRETLSKKKKGLVVKKRILCLKKTARLAR